MLEFRYVDLPDVLNLLSSKNPLKCIVCVSGYDYSHIINHVSVCLFIYVRYCEVVQFFDDYSISPRVIRLNKIGLWFGLLSSFGLSLVANFQETNVIYVHFAGALLCFGVGTIYFWVQVRKSRECSL
jgi:hypothetical protein